MSTLISDRSCLECSIEGESETVSKLMAGEHCHQLAVPVKATSWGGGTFTHLLSLMESEGDGGISLILFFSGYTSFETFIYCNSFYS